MRHEAYHKGKLKSTYVNQSTRTLVLQTRYGCASHQVATDKAFTVKAYSSKIFGTRIKMESEILLANDVSTQRTQPRRIKLSGYIL
jgi:hypothetical protein